MSFDAFLKIDGIPGESTDKAYKDYIELSEFSFGVEQVGSASGSNAGAMLSGRATLKPFSFVHTIDKASPKLMEANAKGTHIANAEMSICRATGDKTEYYNVKMENLVVIAVELSGSAGTGDEVPTERVLFHYDKITWKYTETDHKTGKAKGSVEATWDQSENA